MGLLAFMAPACRTAAPVWKPEADAAWLSELVQQPDVPAGLDREVAWTPDRTALAKRDRLTFELWIDHGDESVRRYLVFEVVGPLLKDGQRGYASSTMTHDGKATTRTSPLSRVRIDLFDDQGQPVASSEVSLADSMGATHVAACEVARRLLAELGAAGLAYDDAGVAAFENRALVDQVIAAIKGSFGSTMSLTSLALGDDLLADLFWDVIEKPSLLSMIRNMDIDVMVEPSYQEATLVLAPLEGLDLAGPSYSLPIAILLNDEPALFLDVLVTDPRSPLTMSTGILALRGRHPSREVSVRARLVGASYASAPR